MAAAEKGAAILEARRRFEWATHHETTGSLDQAYRAFMEAAELLSALIEIPECAEMLDKCVSKLEFLQNLIMKSDTTERPAEAESPQSPQSRRPEPAAPIVNERETVKREEDLPIFEAPDAKVKEKKFGRAFSAFRLSGTHKPVKVKPDDDMTMVISDEIDVQTLRGSVRKPQKTKRGKKTKGKVVQLELDFDLDGEEPVRSVRDNSAVSVAKNVESGKFHEDPELRPLAHKDSAEARWGDPDVVAETRPIQSVRSMRPESLRSVSSTTFKNESVQTSILGVIEKEDVADEVLFRMGRLALKAAHACGLADRSDCEQASGLLCRTFGLELLRISDDSDGTGPEWGGGQTGVGTPSWTRLGSDFSRLVFRWQRARDTVADAADNPEMYARLLGLSSADCRVWARSTGRSLDELAGLLKRHAPEQSTSFETAPVSAFLDESEIWSPETLAAGIRLGSRHLHRAILRCMESVESERAIRNKQAAESGQGNQGSGVLPIPWGVSMALRTLGESWSTVWMVPRSAVAAIWMEVSAPGGVILADETVGARLKFLSHSLTLLRDCYANPAVTPAPLLGPFLLQRVRASCCALEGEFLRWCCEYHRFCAPEPGMSERPALVAAETVMSRRAVVDGDSKTKVHCRPAGTVGLIVRCMTMMRELLVMFSAAEKGGTAPVSARDACATELYARIAVAIERELEAQGRSVIRNAQMVMSSPVAGLVAAGQVFDLLLDEDAAVMSREFKGLLGPNGPLIAISCAVVYRVAMTPSVAVINTADRETISGEFFQLGKWIFTMNERFESLLMRRDTCVISSGFDVLMDLCSALVNVRSLFGPLLNTWASATAAKNATWIKRAIQLDSDSSWTCDHDRGSSSSRHTRPTNQMGSIALHSPSVVDVTSAALGNVRFLEDNLWVFETPDAFYDVVRLICGALVLYLRIVRKVFESGLVGLGPSSAGVEGSSARSSKRGIASSTGTNVLSSASCVQLNNLAVLPGLVDAALFAAFMGAARAVELPDGQTVDEEVVHDAIATVVYDSKSVVSSSLELLARDIAGEAIVRLQKKQKLGAALQYLEGPLITMAEDLYAHLFPRCLRHMWDLILKAVIDVATGSSSREAAISLTNEIPDAVEFFCGEGKGVDKAILEEDVKNYEAALSFVTAQSADLITHLDSASEAARALIIRILTARKDPIVKRLARNK